MFNCCKRKRNHFENIPDDVIINILDYLDSPRKISIEFDDNQKVSWWSIREKSLINTTTVDTRFFYLANNPILWNGYPKKQ